jgi:hypothetical protein
MNIKKMRYPKKHETLIFMGLILITLMSSCATLISKSSQTIKIVSDPPGAEVVINGINKGQTPVDVDVKKELQGQPIELKKEGYEIKTFTPQRKFDTTALLNIFVPIGFIIDAVTGALMKYDPAIYTLQLEKKKK